MREAAPGKRPDDRVFRNLALVISLFIWIYLWLRAMWVPVAHDEVATYFYYIQHQSFLPWLAHWDANNHILNSALSSLFFPFTGSSALSIRLANLLFFPLYALYLFRISLKIESAMIRWIFFFALLMAHHLIAFFALSRGYGMSMALMTASIFYLMEFQGAQRTKHLALTLVFMSIGVLANLSLLNSLIILTGWLFILIWLMKAPSLIKYTRSLVTLLLGVLPVVFFSFLSFRMKERGLLYYGSTESFWNITIRTVLEMIADSSGWITSILTVLIFSFAILLFFRMFIKRPGLSFLKEQQYVFFLFLVGNLLTIQALRWIFEVNYPEDRVGLYFVPLFVGSVAFLCDHLIKKKWSWVPVSVFIFFPVHFFFQAGFYKAPVYKVDIIPEEFYEIVSSAHEKSDYPPTLGGYRVRIFCWAWHDYHHEGTESQVFWNDYPTDLTDYQIVESKDVFWVEKQYETLAIEPVNGRRLMRRKVPAEKIFVDSTTVVPSKDSSVFKNLWVVPAQNYQGQSFYLGVDLDISSMSVPFKAWIVACVQDKDGTDIRYEFIALDWLKYAWLGDDTHLKNGMILHDLPEESSRILLYIWNIDGVAYELGGGRAELFRIE